LKFFTPVSKDSKKDPIDIHSQLDDKMAAEEAQQAPFVKQLAANGKECSVQKYPKLTSNSDRPTRDKAVASLRTFLSGRRKFEELELLKLWKGLFFCMWMSDRPRPQQRLAGDLADLVAVLPESNVLPFLSAFW
jgi:ribosomal RNA-processing protein 1